MLGGTGDTLSWNGYAYVKNNPFKYVDPTGMVPTPVAQENAREEESWVVRVLNSQGFQNGLYVAGQIIEPVSNIATLGSFRRIENAVSDISDNGPNWGNSLSVFGNITIGSLATGYVATGVGAELAVLTSQIQNYFARNSVQSSMPQPPKPPSMPVGRRGSPVDVKPGTNVAAQINGREFSGHALDRMQSQGIPSSVVNNAIKSSNAIHGKVPGTTLYYDKANDLSVIVVNESGRVRTVDFGFIKQ